MRTRVLVVLTALVLATASVGGATASVGNVSIGTASVAVDGYNVLRSSNSLVIYKSPLSVSRADQWGAEVAVLGGKVTAFRDQQTTGPSPMAIPTGGFVLSGSGTARAWLIRYALLGATVALPDPTPPPPPPPPPPPSGNTATINGSSLSVSGTNVTRAANKLVVYNIPPASPANAAGAEVAVDSSLVITAISDRQSTQAGPTMIPPGGYVLSGNGSARSWLLNNAAIGRSATVGNAPPPPAPACSAGSVRLTFDDGPKANITPQILSALKARGAKATFFVTGNSITAWPQGLLSEKADGHRIGNHTFTHPYLTQLTASQVSLELSRTSDLIEHYTGFRPTEWRPPYEDWNASVRQIATNQGMTMVLWDYSTDSKDYTGLTPQEITDRVMNGVFNGATILMHDRIQNTATALPGLLDQLITRGYCFV